MRKINFYEHSLDNNSKNFNRVLNSFYLTSGPVSRNVEDIISKRFNVKHCILTNSWTNGVIAILLSLKLKPEDEIIIPATTFVACANVIEM